MGLEYPRSRRGSQQQRRVRDRQSNVSCIFSQLQVLTRTPRAQRATCSSRISTATGAAVAQWALSGQALVFSSFLFPASLPANHLRHIKYNLPKHLHRKLQPNVHDKIQRWLRHRQELPIQQLYRAFQRLYSRSQRLLVL